MCNRNNSLISQLEEVERSFQQNHILTNELKKLNRKLYSMYSIIISNTS